MALGVIPSGFPPRKIRHRGQQQNRDDAHQVDPEPAGFARRHGASHVGLPAFARSGLGADTSALERGRDAPSSLAEARRYYGAAHSAAWMHHASRASGSANGSNRCRLKVRRQASSARQSEAALSNVPPAFRALFEVGAMGTLIYVVSALRAPLHRMLGADCQLPHRRVSV